MMDLRTMTDIQEEKKQELAGAQPHPLDPEGSAMADTKRFSFDIPVNAVTVDPLR